MIAAVLATALVLLPNVPGASYGKVTQATIYQTICVPGWTAKVRPPSKYTERLKEHQLQKAGLADPASPYGDSVEGYRYEEDHLIPLGLGGAPRSERNLWPQPMLQARRDDVIERWLQRKVCAGEITLRQGRLLIVSWKKTLG